MSQSSYPTAKALREKFNADLAKLQEECEHPGANWMDNAWAPGHIWGRVLVCDVCEKILDRQVPKLTETFDGWTGDGNYKMLKLHPSPTTAKKENEN